LKIVKSPYLSDKSSDFDQTWYTTSDIEPDDSHVTKKTEIFEIQDGGGRHLENRFFGHYSSRDCPISAKFCTRKHNGMSIRATGQKMQIFKIQDGRWLPYLKIVKLLYLSGKLSDFDEIRYTTANAKPDCSNVTKN